jgi:hypothetical protein
VAYQSLIFAESLNKILRNSHEMEKLSLEFDSSNFRSNGLDGRDIFDNFAMFPKLKYFTFRGEKVSLSLSKVTIFIMNLRELLELQFHLKQCGISVLNFKNKALDKFTLIEFP